MTAAAGIHVDVSATQDPAHAERGIAAYARGLTAAIERIEPGLVSAWVLAPDRPAAIGLEPLADSGRLITRDPRTITDASLWHVLSPFDTLHDPLRIQHPMNRPLVVTLYDLIPLIFDDEYLQSPSARARYLAHIALVRRADHVLCISRATADDAIALLGLDAGRVSVAGIAIEPRFSTERPREEALAEALHDVSGLREGFVMYTGGDDSRKNIAGLIHAYAGLPADLRASHQLCIVCRLDAPTLRHYTVMSEDLGVAEDVLLTGYVGSDTIAALYRSAELFVFPSRYEGYGLPVAEALASGTPAVVADNSSLVELVPLPEARFDAADPAAIRAAILRGLTDTDLRERVVALGPSIRTDFDDVARATIAAYRTVLARRTGATAPSGRIAVLCEARLLDETERVRAVAALTELGSVGPIDVFGGYSDPRLLRSRPFDSLGAFIPAEALRGRYDDVVLLRGAEEQTAATEVVERIGRGRVLRLAD